MKLSTTLACLAAPLLAVPVAALPSGKIQPKPAYFVLAGDSTTAVGGGWGDGFLNTTLLEPAAGRNLGRSGATTVSFREGGNWATVLDDIESHVQSHEVFVTIQFGHNDQKEEANISISDFSTNLGRFVEEVRSAKATPILVTSLTRRTFDGSPPRVIENLANERKAALDVAEELDTRSIDLNEASTAYVNAIGSDAAGKYDLAEGDKTHLNDWGSVVFGRLVSDLLIEKYEDIAVWTKPNATLSETIQAGEPA